MPKIVIDLQEYTRKPHASVNFDRFFTCPHCKARFRGLFLIDQSIQGMRIYVCPCCGCLQTVNDVERQLGKEN